MSPASQHQSPGERQSEIANRIIFTGLNSDPIKETE
jgi:hypothetical protein